MKMLKLLAATLLLTAPFALTSCNAPAIQRDLGMTGAQYRDLADYLMEERDMVLESAVPTENPICAGIGEGFEAFDVTTSDGEVYTLILSSSKENYIALMDGDELVNGLIDNGVLPSYDFDSK